jgi:hypothetical protein
MSGIEVKSGHRRQRVADARRARRRLRPSVLVLEGRELLSTLTVNNTNDSGSGSLRAAVAQANADGEGDSIVFSSLFDTRQTITLTGGQLELTGTTAGTTITGPGANLLTVSGNNASRVFLVDANVSASISGLTITGGGNADCGGGLYNRGTLVLTDCTISGNSGGSGGQGGGLMNLGTATVTNCTISDNAARYGGGGVENDVSTATATLTNCTVTGNSAGNQGGGIYNGLSATLTLTNCTVSGNKATSGGGLDNSATATLTNTIVAGNLAGGDVGGPISGNNNLIGGNPLLAPLGNYGGPTQTMPLLPGSPAIGTGTSTGAPTTDQRGFNRGSTVDIGAFQCQGFTLTPNAGSTPQTTLIGTAFANLLAVTVTANNTGQFVNPVDGGVITFTASTSGPSASLSATTASITGGQAGVNATANATTGQYTVTAAAAGAGPVNFVLNNLNLVVTTTLDETDDSDGLVSLREALARAQEFPGPHTITFDPAVFGTTPQTISLTDGPLSLTDTQTTTIIGPGANLLTVSGNNASQVFDIESGSVAISGLTVSGGKTVRGGGLDNNGGSLSLTDCTIAGNSADTGGGVFTQAGGSTTLSDCTVSGNSGGSGGGLSNSNPSSTGSTTTLTNCTVSGNSATGNGGGLYNNAGGTMTLTDCTVSGNTAGATGGGLYISRGATAALTNTIVARNGGGDVQGALDQGSMNNLVGIATGMTGISDGSQGNQVGTGAAPLDPLLAALGDYGGPTFTMALLPGSPAIGGGMSGPGIPTADQRGQPRTGHVDIGAFQSQGFTLTLVAGSSPQSAAAGTAFAKPLAVTVTASNPVEPVDGGLISFAAPSAGASATTSAATAVITGGQAGVTATANNTPGRYTAFATAAGAGFVSFSLTNLAAVSLSETPTPTQATDPSEQVITDLAGLRAAIAQANLHPGPDTIVVDPAGSGTKRRTIRLIGGPLVLTNPASTMIVGPGAKLLTFRGDENGSVFEVQGGSLALSGLTIAGGRAEDGGGIRNDDGKLSLNDVILRNNSARVLGGGLFNNGDATLTNVTVSGDSAKVGGGIANQGSLALTHVSIRRNFARFASGLFNSGTTQLLSRRSPGSHPQARQWRLAARADAGHTPLPEQEQLACQRIERGLAHRARLAGSGRLGGGRRAAQRGDQIG